MTLSFLSMDRHALDEQYTFMCVSVRVWVTHTYSDMKVTMYITCLVPFILIFQLCRSSSQCLHTHTHSPTITEIVYYNYYYYYFYYRRTYPLAEVRAWEDLEA